MKNKTNKGEVGFWVFFFIFLFFQLVFFLLHSDGKLFSLITVYLLLLTAGYILGYRLFRKKIIFANNKQIFACFVILNLILMFVWPMGSNDIFSYIYQSRVFSHHGENPYLVSYSNFPDDPLFKSINNDWSTETTPYGPFFISVGSIMSFLAKDGLFIHVMLYKIMFVIANLATLHLIIKMFKKPELTFLYAFNPLLIFEFIVNGHNEVLVIFFLLLSLYYCFKENSKKLDYFTAIFFFSLGFLVKSTILITAPFLGLYILLRNKNTKDRLIVFFGGIIIFLATIVLFYSLFWEGSNIFGRLLSQTNQTLGIYYSPVIIFVNFLLNGGRVVLERSVMHNAITISRALFVLFYLVILAKYLFHSLGKSVKRHRKAKEHLIMNIFLVLLVFLFMFPTWLMPWYYSYLVLFGLLVWFYKKNDVILNFIFGITLFSISYYFILR